MAQIESHTDELGHHYWCCECEVWNSDSMDRCYECRKPRHGEPVSSCCGAEIREDNRCAACKDGTGALEDYDV